MSAPQKHQRVGIDEVVAHSDRPDFVANTDPELRMWDALDAGTHDDTMQDALMEHMQVLRPLPSQLGPTKLTRCMSTVIVLGWSPSPFHMEELVALLQQPLSIMLSFKRHAKAVHLQRFEAHTTALASGLHH